MSRSPRKPQAGEPRQARHRYQRATLSVAVENDVMFATFGARHGAAVEQARADTVVARQNTPIEELGARVRRV